MMNFEEKAKECTGCGACENICPQNAIQMEYSDDGFLYPVIGNNCVDCGLCDAVCYCGEGKDKLFGKKTFKGFAKNNKIRELSSSGGIFIVLAKYVLKKGGVVYGASFDNKCKEVRHLSTESVALEELARSKYVQSRVGNIYRDVADKLQENRYVLFSGTPCQIRGLKSYLEKKKIRGKLITLDFMCHGVPSSTLFKEYLEQLENEKNKSINDVTFREKDRGWHTQVTKFYFNDGTICTTDSLKHFYYYLFLNNYILRDSCYSCTEYCSHQADITTADCWEIPKEDDDKGVSLIILNSDLGEKIFSEISDELFFEPYKINYEMYAHRYDFNKKKKWKKYYLKHGAKDIERKFFKRQLFKNNVNERVRHIGGNVKRFLTFQNFER